MSDYDAIVVGAGVIGGSIAYHLARAGGRVAIFDDAEPVKAPSASWASAGGVRSQRRDPREWPLTVASAMRWPNLADELGEPTGFVRGGHLHVVERESFLSELNERIERERVAGIDVRFVMGGELNRIAPVLAPHVIAGAYTPNDGHADPRATTHAFAKAARKHGATFVARRIDRFVAEDNHVAGVSAGGEAFSAKWIVLAAGSWSARLAAQLRLALPIRVRSYQMLLSTPREPVLAPTITATERPLSLKQLASGVFLIGGGWAGRIDHKAHTASVIDVSAQGSWQTAIEVVPAVAETSLADSWCGLEGDAFDGAPMIGPVDARAGLYVAAGFSGHGFQIAPAVGAAVADELLTGTESPALRELRPSRTSRSR